MTIERTINGYWKISAMFRGRLVTRLYVDYTRKEAIQAFKLYLKTGVL